MPSASRFGRPAAGQPPALPGSSADKARRFASNPVVQFLAAGLVTVLVLLLVTSWFSKRAATKEAIADARADTKMIAKLVVEPAMKQGVFEGNIAALDKFDRTMQNRIVGGAADSKPGALSDVLRVKIWNRNGRILYSDEARLTQDGGQQFDLGAEEKEIIDKGGTAAEVSDLSRPENRYERQDGRLLEVYTRVKTPSGRPLLFEAYYSYNQVANRSAQVFSAFRPITVAGLLVFLALTAPLVYVLARRLDASAASRERLLLAAVESSDNERRRIARDLHDGVVQELAGTSFALSAAARDTRGHPESSQQLEELAGGVRHSLRSLRSMLVEIYPPELQTEGLAAALDDLVAPCIAAGIAVDVQVADHSDVAPEVIALVWRFAQEAVRNAQRHARPQHLAVRVTRPEGGIKLEVVDDGVGFDPNAAPRSGHLGLRGLRDLARDAGAMLQVQSAPGAGTRVTLEVRRS